MNAKKRKKKAGSRSRQRRRTASRTKAPQAVRLEIPRPRVTEYNAITMVPGFAGGEAGPPSGSPGDYHIVFVLGVPGVSGVATSLSFDDMLAGGDSLLQGAGLQVNLESSSGSTLHVARIIPNSQGRLAQVRLSVTADSFAAAENEAYDAVMPVLSRIAFEADTPVEVTAVLLTEQATQIRSLGATMAGAVQPAPALAGLMTPELRPFLAAYREGLNANSQLYQALSFYKVIEGMAAFHTRRTRAASRRGGEVAPDPLAKRIPAEPADLTDMTEWARGVFAPHLGKTFAEIKDSVSDTIRNAIAHIIPDRDIRVADYHADIRACRNITPILRYIARELIRDELAALATPRDSPGAFSLRSTRDTRE
jgi:hypothetical protein